MSKNGDLFEGDFDHNDWRYLGVAAQDTLKAAASLGEHNYLSSLVVTYGGRRYYVLPTKMVLANCVHTHDQDRPLPLSALRRRLESLRFKGRILAPSHDRQSVLIRTDVIDWVRSVPWATPAA